MKIFSNILLPIALIALIAFFFSTYLIVFYPDEYISLLEMYISEDGTISNPSAIFFKVESIFLLIIIFILSFKYFFIKNLFPLKYLSKFDSVSIIFILSLTISFSYSVIDKSYTLHDEDSIFENLTAIFSISASILFLISIRNFKSYPSKLIIIALSIFSFLFGMEEISWGQRVFNWETGESWSSINHQNETNIHNLFNPFFQKIYLIFNFLALCLFLAREKVEKYLITLFPESDIHKIIHKRESGYYALIFFFLIFQAQLFGGELTEEILSIILLSYALKYLSIKT